jgi:hypothetical protein
VRRDAERLRIRRDAVTVLTPAIDWRRLQEMQRDGSTFEESEEASLEIRQPSRRFVKDGNVAD